MNLKNDDIWQDLKNKVEFLSQPDSYIEPGQKVEVIETHMSWIFLTEQYAYKLKKPVQFPFLNLSQLDVRYSNCQKELKINQFLAPDVYLGVVPLMQGRTSHFYPVGSRNRKNIVDWLLKMRRLPRELTLEQLILKNSLKQLPQIKEAAQMLVAFYQRANPENIKPEEYKQQLKNSIQENSSVLIKTYYGLNQEVVKVVHQKQLYELEVLTECINERVSQGKIIECHGDLRPEHIWLLSPPVIIDRLEFNDKLRIMDPVDELSYLFLECEILKRMDIGKLFLTVYQEISKDPVPERLFAFYKSYRACLRAKICIWHLDDPRIQDLDKWFRKAEKYLNLSELVPT
ncbi:MULTISPECIES: hypothetical protein [unclassified Legionella]|uniref:hypothetical protein n=1 Tax=unclassified Legionella TaxID=2622702 RepID=UPI001056218B|nr:MULTISPECIES: hypothetical protein [unclassified Legionella]MDI9818377.1 hypothetical protein [Legionella sp. PL877]